MKRKAPRSLIALGVLLLILAFVWVAGEIGSVIYTNGRDPNDVGYLVWYEGTPYFVKGDNLTDSDFKNFSYDDIVPNNLIDPYSEEQKNEEQNYSSKFRGISILDNAGIDITVKRIKTGDKVAIWYNEVLESYPGEIKLIRIEKVD